MSNNISGAFFQWLHGNHLIYNTCWEDPRLDRIALEITPQDNILIITSAGCNTLDLALQSPTHIYAVDMNPRQNALLELKMAAIRTLDFEDFFQLFGKGRHQKFERLYAGALRAQLPEFARAHWDKQTHFFESKNERDGFYFHGTSGIFARMLNLYLDRRPGLRDGVEAILAADTLDKQREIYYGGLKSLFWNRMMRWAANRDATLAMVGVPRAQRLQVERFYEGGVAEFVEHCLESVFAHLPLGDNYFWRVYLTGQYTESCCPEYLKPENFHALKGGLVDRVSTHTTTVEHFLNGHNAPISKFVLLDHMDWLSSLDSPLLQQEWQAIINRAAEQSRVIWRSGGLKVDFVDPLMLSLHGRQVRVGDILSYKRDLAEELHKKDRVHTYGSFYIADLATA